MAKKKGKKKDLSGVLVDVERQGSIRSREFVVVNKKGDFVESIGVAHVKEAPPGKGESYLTTRTTIVKGREKKGPLQLHRTKAEVAKKFPRISPKLPRLR